MLRSLQHCSKNEHYIGHCAHIRPRQRGGIAIAHKDWENQQSYAPRKNVTHEPTGGRVQSTSGQYSILSAPVPDGDTSHCDIIQDGRFQLSRTFQFEAHTVLLSVDGDSPGQYAFESVGGNISLMGIVDFAEIRPHCTEVTLAVHYEIKNKLFAWLDRRLHFVDSFVNAELRSIRAHFEGIRSSYLERPRVLPILQTAHA